MEGVSSVSVYVLLPQGIRARLLLQPIGSMGWLKKRQQNRFYSCFFGIFCWVLGFISGHYSHCIAQCSLHRVQEIQQTRAGLREIFPFSNTVAYIFPLFIRCPTFLSSGGYASWTLIDIVQTPVLLLSQMSPAFHSLDQLKGSIDPWSLFSSWALVTFMNCLEICWKMLLAMMPKGWLICAWKRWCCGTWGSASLEGDQNDVSVFAWSQVNLGLTLSEMLSDLE